MSGIITYIIFMVLVGILAYLYCKKYVKDDEDIVFYTGLAGILWIVTITIIIICILGYVINKYVMKNCLDKLFDFIHKILP